MRAGKRFNLLISNKDMNYIIKTIKSLEDSNVLTDGITETVKHKIENKKMDFFLLCQYLGCFISATSDYFSSKSQKWKRNYKITVEFTNDANKRNKNLTFKNNVPFRSCISKINNTSRDIVENLDIVLSMDNSLQYSNVYFMTSGSLWIHYRDEVNDVANSNNPVGIYRTNYNKTTTSKSFEYMTKIIGKTPADNNTLDREVLVSLKYFSIFWRFLICLCLTIKQNLIWHGQKNAKN